jgi:hypothetical protein
MTQLFPLSPRYRLDDKSPWLMGVAPTRYYWIFVNGDLDCPVAIPGLTVSSLTDLKTTIRRFRGLQSGQQISLVRSANMSAIYCVGENCYAIEAEVEGAKVWHLFDYETLDCLLMTSHPYWQCAPKDVN